MYRIHTYTYSAAGAQTRHDVSEPVTGAMAAARIRRQRERGNLRRISLAEPVEMVESEPVAGRSVVHA